jgi:hypothetical protein
MNISLRITIILFYLGLCLEVFGQGGPPMLTDDPGTVNKGHLEINTGIASEHSPSDSFFEFPFIDVNYGVSKRQHLNFEIPLVSRYMKDIGTQVGIGKLGIGTKFRFFDQDKLGIDISTHPALFFGLSKRAINRGIVEEGTELFIPIELQKRFNKNIFGVEVGRLMNSRNNGTWTYGMLYAREFNTRMNAAFEITGDSDPELNATTLFLNIGARLSMIKSFTLLVSGGKSIVLPENAEKVYLAYLALQIAL